MEPWYKVVTPRKELREGRSLDPSEFAVHLDQIVNGTAPEDYREPAKFFARTYFASALVEHCGMVVRRLVGETANTAPVLSLITQFGDGKTHTLATLYHLVNAGPQAGECPGIPELLAKIGLREVPKAQVAVFVGNAWDAEEGRETPWIDIAWQLAGDAGRRVLGKGGRTSPPGTAHLQQLFQLVNEPILILFDETLNYIGRCPHQADGFHSFVQNLTSALTATERAVGLLSLPASPTEMTPTLYEPVDTPSDDPKNFRASEIENVKFLLDCLEKYTVTGKWNPFLPDSEGHRLSRKYFYDKVVTNWLKRLHEAMKHAFDQMMGRASTGALCYREEFSFDVHQRFDCIFEKLAIHSVWLNPANDPIISGNSEKQVDELFQAQGLDWVYLTRLD